MLVAPIQLESGIQAAGGKKQTGDEPTELLRTIVAPIVVQGDRRNAPEPEVSHHDLLLTLECPVIHIIFKLNEGRVKIRFGMLPLRISSLFVIVFQLDGRLDDKSRMT
jgi:hypothetical protein